MSTLSFERRTLPKLNAIIDRHKASGDYLALAVMVAQLTELSKDYKPDQSTDRLIKILHDHYGNLGDWADRDGFCMTLVLYAKSSHLHEVHGHDYETDQVRMSALLDAVPDLIARCGDISTIDLDNPDSFPPVDHDGTKDPAPVPMAMASSAEQTASFWNEKVKAQVRGLIALAKKKKQWHLLAQMHSVLNSLVDSFDPYDAKSSIWNAINEIHNPENDFQRFAYTLNIMRVAHSDDQFAFQADLPGLRDLAVNPNATFTSWESKYKKQLTGIIQHAQAKKDYETLSRISYTLRRLAQFVDPDDASMSFVNHVLETALVSDEFRFRMTLKAYLSEAEHTGESLKHFLLALPGLINLARIPDRLAQVQQWATRFAPILYLHPEEAYLPTNVEWFAARCDVGSLEALPLGEASRSQRVNLSDTGYRSGDLDEAKVYVHVKSGPVNTTDLQYWYFYAYNGPGTARVKSLVNLLFGDQTLHSGNPSLAPLGEHEGDWEHMTLRIDNHSEQIQQVWCSQHSNGAWYKPGDFESQGERIIAYASKNGHACYPQANSNYTHHMKIPIGATKLEFFLRNDTGRGKMLDVAQHHEIVAVDLGGLPFEFKEASWLEYRGRWGAFNNKGITDDIVRDILEAALGPVLGTILGYTPLTEIASSIAGIYKFDDQKGPDGPKNKGCWNGVENDPESESLVSGAIGAVTSVDGIGL